MSEEIINYRKKRELNYQKSVKNFDRLYEEAVSKTKEVEAEKQKNIEAVIRKEVKNKYGFIGQLLFWLFNTLDKKLKEVQDLKMSVRCSYVYKLSKELHAEQIAEANQNLKEPKPQMVLRLPVEEDTNGQ